MALWGSKDLVGNAGTIDIDLGTKAIAGSATTFVTVGFEVSQGDVLVVGAGATFGHAVIDTVTNDTVASIASTQFLIPDPITNTIEGASYYITQQPISAIEGGQYEAPEAKSNRTSSVYGVDNTEIGLAAEAVGDAGKYAPAHAGWVGVTTYMSLDEEGNPTLRVKTEVLVAGGTDLNGLGGILNDRAADDAEYPNV